MGLTAPLGLEGVELRMCEVGLALVREFTPKPQTLNNPEL